MKNRTVSEGINALIGISYGLIAIAAVLAVFHTALNLFFDLAVGLPFGYDIKGDVGSTEELKNLYVVAARSSTSMDRTELLIWVVVPIVLITIGLSILYREQLKKALVLGVIFGFLIYAVAFLSNQFDGYVRGQQFLNKRFSVTGKIFEKVKYPGAVCTFEDSSVWDAAPQFFEFKTGDNLDRVSKYYFEKGFKIKEIYKDGSETLVLGGESFGFPGKELSLNLGGDKGNVVIKLDYTSLMVK